MRERWFKDGDEWVKQKIQDEPEVDHVLKVNEYIRAQAAGRTGGAGSQNMRFLARVPELKDAEWRIEWRRKGGHNGTGMSATDYCLLKASLPDYSDFVVTPSGRTGVERRARRKIY